MNSIFKGTGVALVTPFNPDGSIDFKNLSALVEHLIQGGIDYLVVMGTTAESPCLSEDEKAEVLAQVLKQNAYRLPVVYGMGGNNTADLTKKIAKASLIGVSGILSVTPYYNKPSQEGLYRHYKAVCDATELPVILYNVPGRTGCNMTASTTLRIAAECPNAAAVKEASGNFEQIMQIRRDSREDFLVISGDDAITMPLISCGIDGVISVAANAYPKAFSEMVNHALAGDFAAARELHYQLLEPIRCMFAEGSPAGVKAFLHHMKLANNVLRLPAFPVSDSLHASIGKIVSSKILL